MKKYLNHRNVAMLMRIAALAGLTQLGFNISPVFAATLSRSADVSGTVSAVWSMIGPFCAIKDWLPPVGTCTETGSSPAERILVTKDGKATFIEMQTARSEAEHSYSYTFKSSPLPVTDYTSTLKVVAKGDGVSTVTWSSTYVPNAGKEHDARKALTGIYESGLASIKAKFSKELRKRGACSLLTGPACGGRPKKPSTLLDLPALAVECSRAAFSLLLALRTPEGRAAVLGESLDDAVAASGLAFLAFAVIDLKRVLEIAELARCLAMIAQRRAAGLDRLIQHRVNRRNQPLGVIGRFAARNPVPLSGFRCQRGGQATRR